MKTLSFFLTTYLLLLTAPASAQITFQKTFGGTNDDKSSSVQQTTDGGYIIAGTTSSYGAGNFDVYLIRINTNGDSVWTRTFGGMGGEMANSVQQTSDGGFIITGVSTTFGAGGSDVYLIKTDTNGNSLWSKTFGGTNFDYGYSVRQTTDGGYIIAGATESYGAGLQDVYLVKTDANGDSLWTKTFGGANDDLGNSVLQTTDGGYIIAGTNFLSPASSGVYLIKTDGNGDSLWTKTFGGTGSGRGQSVQQTIDGGYIITGSTTGFGAGSFDVYLIKTDANGNSLWTKTFGGTDGDYSFSVQQTTDGGYIITGYTYNLGIGPQDINLIRTNPNGDTLWTKTFGGPSFDYGNSVQQSMDGGYIIAGIASNFGIGNSDVYIIKTDTNGNTGCNQGSMTTIVTTPAAQVANFTTYITLPLTIVTTASTVVGSGGTVTTLCTSVGISPLSFGEGSGVRFSPNPSPGNFTITFPGFIDRGEVQIFNAYGSKVFTQNIHNTSSTEIHLKHIPVGIYFVKVWDGDKYFSNKIVIQQY